MTFPTFPATLTWNTPYRDRERVNSARYQSGVEQVERIGINRRSQSIDVTIRIQNAAEIENFLRERRGRPFRLRTDSQLLGENLLYSCDEWEMPELGKNLWEFRATFNQERRFEPKIAQYLSLSANTLNLTAGQSIGLTAGLSGFSVMPTLSWSIVSGPGAITPGVDNLATYSSDLNFSGGTVIVRVRVLGTGLEATVNLTIAPNPVVIAVTIVPATVDRNANDINPTLLTASVDRSGGEANGVLWSIRSGTALLNASTSLATNVLIPNLDQTIVVRATSIADSSKWTESTITVRKPALISGINASASPSSLSPGGMAQLSAIVVGVGTFDPSVTWSIVSGGGTLNGSTYTASQNTGTIVLEAVSVANPLIKQQLTIAVVNSISSTITSVVASASPNSVQQGGTSQLSAVVTGTGTYDPSVTWSIVSGPGTVNDSILTANGVGTIVVRATSVQDSSKTGNTSISSTVAVQDAVTGITGTVIPSTIYIGQTSSISVTVTGTGNYSNATIWFHPDMDIVGTGNSRTFTAQSFPNTSSVRVSSVSNSEIFVDIPITIIMPTITSVVVSSPILSMPNNSSMQLTATVTGEGPFDSAVSWSIVSGPGSINAGSLTAIGVGTIVVQATSVQDSSKTGAISIESTAEQALVTTGYVTKSFGAFRIDQGRSEGLQNGATIIFYTSNTNRQVEGFVALFYNEPEVWGLFVKTEFDEYLVIVDISKDLQIYNWTDFVLTESEYLAAKSSLSATILPII